MFDESLVHQLLHVVQNVDVEIIRCGKKKVSDQGLDVRNSDEQPREQARKEALPARVGDHQAVARPAICVPGKSRKTEHHVCSRASQAGERKQESNLSMYKSKELVKDHRCWPSETAGAKLGREGFFFLHNAQTTNGHIDPPIHTE